MTKYRILFIYLAICLFIIIIIFSYFGKNILNTLKIENDNDGEEDNQVPIIITKERTNGLLNEEIDFNVTAYDPDGWITLYEWDFDGDGIFDWKSSEDGNTTHIYHIIDVYWARIRVTDNNGFSNYSITKVFVFEQM